jgi:hypothetical protein
VSWLLPSALAIAGVAALAALALHLIARSRPLAESLPTARFVPQRPVRARARSIALSDVPLLLLRIGAVLALGAAVAAPVFPAAHGRVRRIVIVDRSRDVADAREARDSARAAFRDGDVLLAFDSIATRLSGRAALDSAATVPAAGSMSAALGMALHVAAQLASEVDSIELVIVSPVTVEEIDRATTTIRDQWPGRIRVVRLREATSDERAPRVESADGSADVVLAGLSLMGAVQSHGDVRVVRGRPSADDTAWASDSGHVLVHWPANADGAAWQPRPTIDAIGGVASSSGTLIGRFPRVWTLTGSAIARWADGDAAAVEHGVGRGCIRDVGIVVDPASDLTLRAPFRRFAERLLEPCGGVARTRRADSSAIESIVGGKGITRLATASSLREPSGESSFWTPWLLGLGAALLLVEVAARRMDRRA